MYQQFQIALTLEMNTIKIYFYCDFSFTERNTILISRIGGFSTTSAENDECKDS